MIEEEILKSLKYFVEHPTFTVRAELLFDRMLNENIHKLGKEDYVKEYNKKCEELKKKANNGSLSENDSFENLVLIILRLRKCQITQYRSKLPTGEELLKILRNPYISKHESKIVNFLLNHSIAEASGEFGITRERVNQIVKTQWLKTFHNYKGYLKYEVDENECTKEEKNYMEALDRYEKSGRI